MSLATNYPVSYDIKVINGYTACANCPYGRGVCNYNGGCDCFPPFVGAGCATLSRFFVYVIFISQDASAISLPTTGSLAAYGDAYFYLQTPVLATQNLIFNLTLESYGSKFTFM